jgi:hypothetical protein
MWQLLNKTISIHCLCSLLNRLLRDLRGAQADVCRDIAYKHEHILEGILAKDAQKANAALRAALPLIRESWEPETTVRTLRLIRETREARQDVVAWAQEVEDGLKRQIKR